MGYLIRIMLGIMLVTMFLSMWLNNTATTAMMVPIVDAMLHELGQIIFPCYHAEIPNQSQRKWTESQIREEIAQCWANSGQSYGKHCYYRLPTRLTSEALAL